MKILALLGSPRKNGNSDILAEEVMSGAREKGAQAKKVYLDDYCIRPIGEVIDNTRKREDKRKDDDFVEILNQFLDADVIIWATPVYWFGVSAQMKCFLDRLSSYFNVEPYAGKFTNKGHIVLCTYGRTDIEHGDSVIIPMKQSIEVLRGKYLGSIKVPSCYQKGKIKEKVEILNEARKLGNDFCG